jgi:cell shape-determining protein MreD
MLGAVVAVSLLDSRRASAVFAIAAGLSLDAIGGVGIPLSAVIYFTVTLLVGGLGEKMLPKFGSFLVLMLPAILIREAFGLGRLLLWDHVTLRAALLERLLPEAILTAVFVLPLYGLVRLSMLPFREKRR